MGIIKMHNNVPDIYTTSRDFQLMLNLQSLVFNGNKFDTDTIEDITSTRNIRSSLLPLLAQKVGFFTDKSFSEEELRQILIAFPYLLRNKGSLYSIKGAVNAFLHIKHLNIESTIEINQRTINKAYTVVVALDTDFVDTEILEEIFKYILPVGWDYDIVFRKDFTKDPDATSKGELERPIEVRDEIVLTTYDNGEAISLYDMPTSNLRDSSITPDSFTMTSYMQNLLLGAVDMGYVQGNNMPPSDTTEVENGNLD